MTYPALFLTLTPNPTLALTHTLNFPLRLPRHSNAGDGDGGRRCYCRGNELTHSLTTISDLPTYLPTYLPPRLVLSHSKQWCV